jgi:4-amino-4-deoxy-L-arabinose transferase-like glycosyltransferase
VPRALLAKSQAWAGWHLVAAVLPFLALTLWWIAADARVPDFDSGRHLQYTFAMREALAGGDLLAPITQDNFNHYPPLLYLVGLLGMAIGGAGVDSALVAQALVFMPLLALGCWGTARIAYGPLAGVLAAVFVLGAPMIVSLFHMYMLDATQASLVAVCVWLVLQSERFGRVGLAALAGLAGGGAMLLKPTTPIFLVGFVLVVLARGGWRHWRGLLVFLAVGAVVSFPWYLEHYDQLAGLTGGATGSTTQAAAAAGNTYITPPRYSVTNALWYGWNLMNLELLGPLFISFVVGAVVATVRFARNPRKDDPTPELLAGGLVAYLGITYIALKDPRYTLPALVYVAAFGVAWVPALRTARLRTVGAAAIAAVAIVNVVMVSFGVGDRIRIGSPRAETLLGERSIRLFSPAGFVVGKARDDSEVLEVMRAVRADGITTMELDPGGDGTFAVSGLQVLLRFAGLQQPPSYQPTALDPRTAFLLRHPVPPGGPEPCGRMADGQGIYVVLGGNVVVPFEDYRFYCPPGAPGPATGP